MKKGRIAEIIYVFFFTCVASMAMLYSVCDAFSVTYKASVFYPFAGLYLCCLFVLLYKKKFSGWDFLKITFLGECILLLVGRMRLWESFQYLCKTIWVQLCVYFQEGRYAENVKMSEQTWGLLFFFLLFVFAAVWMIAACKKCRYGVGILAVMFSLPFLVGMVPNRMTLILFLVSFIGMMCGKTGRHHQAGTLQGAAFGLCVAAVAFGIGIPLLSEPLKPILEGRESFEKKVEIFWEEKIRNGLWKKNDEDKATGGVSDGRLGAYSGLEQDTEVQLEVRSEEKPEENLYIRGFVGEDYTGHAWRRSSERRFSFETGEVEIHNKKANRKYRYHAYPSEEQIPKEWKKRDSEYTEKVQKKYVEVPQNIKESFGKVVNREIFQTAPERVAIEIAQLLSDTASYSLNPGKTPEEEDFAEYFFFDKKKGYCTHFATTAVLLFRMKNIPSRYIGGYVVRPSDFVKQTDGTYLAEVTGESAHAWAEIYVPGKGWIPEETTPGYESRDIVVDEELTGQEKPLGNESTEPPTSPEKPEESPSQNPSQNHASEQEEQEKQSQEKGKTEDGDGEEVGKKEEEKGKEQKIHLWMVCLLLIVGILIAGCIFRMRRRKQNDFIPKDYREKTKEAFYKIYERLALEKKIAKDAELDADFIEGFRSYCPQLEKEEIEKLLDIVYRANYGKQEIEKSEYLFVRRILLLLEKRK